MNETRYYIVRHVLFWVLLALIVAVLAPTLAAMAQDTTPPVVVTPDFDSVTDELQNFLLVHVALIATGLQFLLNQVKSITDILAYQMGWKDPLNPDAPNTPEYLRWMYLVRFVALIVVYVMAGGVPVTRQFLPSLAMFPDIFMAGLAIGVTGAGTEFQFQFLKFLSSLKDTRKIVTGEISPPAGGSATLTATVSDNSTTAQSQSYAADYQGVGTRHG